MRKPKNVYPIIKVYHNRPAYFYPENIAAYGGKGGVTTVTLEVELGVMYRGASYCSPVDVFSKKQGKSLAFGRMLRAMPYGKRAEIAVWCLDQIGKVDDDYVNAGLFDLPTRDIAFLKKRDATIQYLHAALDRDYGRPVPRVHETGC